MAPNVVIDAALTELAPVPGEHSGPLAAAQFDNGTIFVFAADHILASGLDSASQISGRFGLQAVNPPTIDGKLPVTLPDGEVLRVRLTSSFPVVIEVPPDWAHKDRLAAALVDDGSRATTVTVSSAAGVAALTAAVLAAEFGGGLDLIGDTTALATADYLDSNGWQSTIAELASGPDNSNMVRAWQLYGLLQPVRRPWIAVVDVGFITQNGVPKGPESAAPPVGSAGDLPFLVRSANFRGIPTGDPTIVDDALAATVGTSGPCPAIPKLKKGAVYHGAGTAPIVAAVPGNSYGAAGTGGVADPALFLIEVDLSVRQWMLAVWTAVYVFNVDVINMSLEVKYDSALAGRWGTPAGWFDLFEEATNRRVVIVASAGNDNGRLPDNFVLPATRTAGVVTVGALADATPTPAWYSNYGPSVDIWASDAVPTLLVGLSAPFDVTVGKLGGTSAAAPAVTGVVAMMKSLDTSLGVDEVITLLRDSAWDGPVPVAGVAKGADKRLNAYGALEATVHGKIARSVFPPTDPAAPHVLQLEPAGLGVLAASWAEVNVFAGAGTHYLALDVPNEPSVVTVDIATTASLNPVFATLLGPTPDSEGVTLRTNFGSRTEVAAGAAGMYRLRIHAPGPNRFNLAVRVAAIPILPDAYEPNDSVEQATPLTAAGPFDLNCTLHDRSDVDWLRLDVMGPSTTAAGRPRHRFVNVNADLDLTVDTYDPGLGHISSDTGRVINLDGWDARWVRVIGTAMANRYTLSWWVAEFPTMEELSLIPSVDPDDVIGIVGPSDPPFHGGWFGDQPKFIIADLRRAERANLVVTVTRGEVSSIALVDASGRQVRELEPQITDAGVEFASPDEDMPPAAYAVRILPTPGTAAGGQATCIVRR